MSLELYESWLADGMHGEMEYLKRHFEKKANPQSLLPAARSAIVVAENYLPHPGGELPLKHARVALYARGRDYHDWLKEKVEYVAQKLKERFPQEEFKCFTDSAPVLERDLAARAGLGWIGKNGCLIDTKRGSLFLLGEIYTSLCLKEREAEVLHPDRCGKCTRCIDICPTQALVEPRKLDARKCISYLTIEQKRPADLSLRHGIGDWFFGCDLCQTVCPWNEKAFGVEKMQKERETSEETQGLIEELRWILQEKDEVLKKQFSGTPLLRRGPLGLKRNALIVAGNRRLRELQNEIELFQFHEELSELAQWALAQLQ